MLKVLLTQRFSLSLAHFIPEDYVGEEMARIHGHDFKVDITLSRPHVDFKNIVQQSILIPYQNTNIMDNFALGTGEALAYEFLKILRNTDLGDSVLSVQLVETRKNRFQCLANT